jgi:hypothetical protein
LQFYFPWESLSGDFLMCSSIYLPSQVLVIVWNNPKTLAWRSEKDTVPGWMSSASWPWALGFSVGLAFLICSVGLIVCASSNKCNNAPAYSFSTHMNFKSLPIWTHFPQASWVGPEAPLSLLWLPVLSPSSPQHSIYSCQSPCFWRLCLPTSHLLFSSLLGPGNQIDHQDCHPSVQMNAIQTPWGPE